MDFHQHLAMVMDLVDIHDLHPHIHQVFDAPYSRSSQSLHKWEKQQTCMIKYKHNREQSIWKQMHFSVFLKAFIEVEFLSVFGRLFHSLEA